MQTRTGRGLAAQFLGAGPPEAMTFPKRFNWLDSPAEILKLVDQLMPLLLVGEHPTLAILRDQLRVSRVRSVELSGVGFFAEFEVPVDVVTVTPPRIVGGDAEIELAGVEHGAGCVLFIDNGRLAMLEGYPKAASHGWKRQLSSQ